jgi:cytochrome c-type biogenesis protein CcmE
MKIKGKYLVASILLLFSAFLAYDSLSNYVNPYLSVTQVVKNLDHYNGKSLQVMGVVGFGSFDRGNNGTIRFSLNDGTETVSVKYTGALPQNFDEGKDVVIVGSLNGDATVEATQILVKCPSKYEGENPPQQNNHVFLTAFVVGLVAIAYLGITMLWKRG